MKRWKKTTLWVVVILVGFFLFATWYKYRYSMDPATPFAVNSPLLKHRVLIATQGSTFKDAVVEGVIDSLESKPVHIKVIDVSGLNEIQEKEWTAIVVLHTWENWKPQPDVKIFIDRVGRHDNIIVVATSGAGDFAIENINAITSASKKDEIPGTVRAITSRINTIIQSQNN